MVKGNYKVIWDDEAKASLRRIYYYIRKCESINQARKVRGEIRDLATSLGFMPFKFSKDEYLLGIEGDIRFKIIWSYKILYEITDEYIIILDVFHTSRDPENLKRVKRR